MKNKTLANCLIAVLGLSVLGGILGLSGDFYTVVGLGMFVFGILAIVRLYKLENAIKHE